MDLKVLEDHEVMKIDLEFKEAGMTFGYEMPLVRNGSVTSVRRQRATFISWEEVEIGVSTLGFNLWA